MNYGTDFRRILQAGTPIIDVRAPAEFQQGSTPGAINLPLMNDEERAAVGTCYKRYGAQAALTLGHTLVAGETRARRLNAWQDAFRQHPNAYLCCARGGQRSHITQSWLRDTGIDAPLIAGGYKSLRQAALTAIGENVQRPMVLIGGCTGNGKTLLVQATASGIDLEGLARHRGSSFGRTLQPQLSQASFENALAAVLLQCDAQRWVLEDEGRTIGANHLPECLRNRMAEADIVVVDDPVEIRLERLRDEYFIRMNREFRQSCGEAHGWQAYSDYLHHGLFAIRRRLGLERFAVLDAALTNALEVQQREGSTDAHFNWLQPLLETYYDPMYLWQLSKKAEKVVFRGSWHDVAHWLAE